MRLSVIVLLTAAMALPALANPARPAREDLVRIELVSPEQAKDLDRLGVAINEVRVDYCIGEAAPELLNSLAAQGWKFTVLTEDISGVYYNNSLTKSPLGQYLTYTQFIDTMNTIAVNNPAICGLETLATTTTGKLLLAMKVSDSVSVDEVEPVIMWDANTHGDEKIGWAVAFEFLKYLVGNYGTDSAVTNLVDHREIWICPMFNPDGYANSDRYNANGVDLNRNWGWMWGYEYDPGNSVMGERETGGLANMLFGMPVTIWVSYHAGTEMIPYPWSYSGAYPGPVDTIPENHAIDWLSAGYSARGNGYDYGQGSVIMYLINGSSKDLGYGAMGAMAWSIEVNYTKTPPASEIDPTFNRNRHAQLWFCRMAGHGIQGVVTDSVTGLPVRAQVWLQPSNWASFTERTNGDFHRFALPGTYSINVRAPGYEPKTVSDIVVPGTGDSSVAVGVQLMPSMSQPLFGFQVIACSAVTVGANSTRPVRSLGVHDGDAYTLDNGHWIIIDMDRQLRNGTGDDFTVFRSSGTGTASVMAASDWKGPWTTVGTANGAQTSFDLGSVALDSARYLKLKASGSFMFDAVEGVPLTGVAEPPANLRPLDGDNFELDLNPKLARTTLTVSCAPIPTQDLRLDVFDVQGRRIRALTLPARAGTVTLPVADINNGIYFVRPEARTGLGARFVKTR